MFGLAPAGSVRLLSERVEKAEARAAEFKRQFVEARSEALRCKERAEDLQQQLKSAQAAVEHHRARASEETSAIEKGRAKAEKIKSKVAGTARTAQLANEHLITGNETLVMTATFRAETTPTLIVRQEEERILQYMCALVSWARPKNVQRIVFCENSNTRFDFSNIVRYLEAAGKEVEFLVFDGNKEAARLGKGFGEGEILEYVYNNSRLIRRSGTFYKITGRIFVRNFDLVSECTGTPEAFRRKKGKAGKKAKANTVFFRCSLALFETKLLHSYRQVDEPNGVYLEHIYFNQLRDADPADFGVLPALVGQQASTGKIYEAYEPDIIRIASSFLPT